MSDSERTPRTLADALAVADDGEQPIGHRLTVLREAARAAIEAESGRVSLDGLADALDAAEWHKWKSPQIDRIHTQNLARAILARLSPSTGTPEAGE